MLCPLYNLLIFNFLAFDGYLFCVVVRFFHPRHNGQWPPTSKDFLSQILLFYSQHVLDCLVILFPTCFGLPCYSIPNMFWTALLFYSQHVFELLIMKVDLFILCYHNYFFKVALQLFTTVKNELYYWALCLIRTSFSKLCCLHFKWDLLLYYFSHS